MGTFMHLHRASWLFGDDMLEPHTQVNTAGVAGLNKHSSRSLQLYSN